MIAQPTSTSGSGSVEEELVVLRTKLDDALYRMSNLEGKSTTEGRPTLFPIDAPPMIFARQLCAEIFPGPVEIEIATAPDEPEAKWYTLTVFAQGNAQEIVDKQLRWASQLDRQFPNEAVDIRLSVKPA